LTRYRSSPSRDLVSIPGFTDPFSSLSHLLAAFVFAILTFALVGRGRSSDLEHEPTPRYTARVISLLIFSLSAVLLLTCSGFYHLVGHAGPARAFLQRLDHAAIFILIAGTFTPIHVIMFRGPARWAMLALIWTIAILGATFKTVYFASTPATLGLVLYVCMGWIGAIPITMLWRAYGAKFIAPLLLGGVAYTIGAAIEWAEPRPLLASIIRAHELFHVAVIAGLALHWRFISIIAVRRV
jgi:channel protein (hemolysin III family)